LGEAGLNYTTVHNSYLSLFAELGILGFLAYLAIMKSMLQLGWGLYRRGIHSNDWWRGLAVITTIIAYQIPAFFANTLYSYDLGAVYFYVFLGGVAGLYSRQPILSHAPTLVTFGRQPSAIPIAGYHHAQLSKSANAPFHSRTNSAA
jgi:O-antigen ligase